MRRPVLGIGALLLLLLLGSSAAGTSTVSLTLTVNGKGTVKVSDKPAVSCIASCKRTIRVPVGKRVTVTPAAGTLWKLAPFTGACQGASESCSFAATGSQTLTVTFLAPGVRANPIPLNTAWRLPLQWMLKIDSSTANVRLKKRDRTPKIPSAGSEFFMLYIEETYTGRGSSSTMTGPPFHVVGRHNVDYPHESRTNACGPGSGPLPEPDLQPYNRTHKVDSGQTVAGNICFEIATNDASSLLLYVRRYNPTAYVWFALH